MRGKSGKSFSHGPKLMFLFEKYVSERKFKMKNKLFWSLEFGHMFAGNRDTLREAELVLYTQATVLELTRNLTDAKSFHIPTTCYRLQSNTEEHISSFFCLLN